MILVFVVVVVLPSLHPQLITSTMSPETVKLKLHTDQTHISSCQYILVSET